MAQFISAAAPGWRSHLSRYSSKACCYCRCAPGAIRVGDSNRPADHLADARRSIGRQPQFHFGYACDCYPHNHQRDSLHHWEHLALHYRDGAARPLTRSKWRSTAWSRWVRLARKASSASVRNCPMNPSSDSSNPGACARGRDRFGRGLGPGPSQ